MLCLAEEEGIFLRGGKGYQERKVRYAQRRLKKREGFSVERAAFGRNIGGSW